jgi:glycosyltransferase involved in cell wall biosynthesis
VVSGNQSKKIGIVIPVLNDWESLARLVGKLEEQAKSAKLHFHIFIVDDGSSTIPGLDCLSTCNLQLIRLCSSLGHQRAIAVGLVVASQMKQIEAVVVMDADGEDRPEDVLRLVATWREEKSRIIVAHRNQRSEGLAFKFSYAIYKLAFRIMTGQKIDFGNFCLLPRESLQALAFNPSIWNNLAAAITRSQIPRTGIGVDRGSRLAGKSRMDFEGLVIHGVSAMAVYADVVLLRILFGASTLAGFVVLAIAGVVAIRFGTDWAIPGWASYLAASFIIILLQALLISAISLFQLLSLRNVKTFIPALDAMSFVLDTPITITSRISNSSKKSA